MNVLITGASGGLGRSLADECARRGYRLFLTDLREDRLRSLQAGLERQYGADVLVRACDLTQTASVDHLLADIDRYDLTFDMLLNVAGIDHEGGFLNQDCQKILDIVSLDIMATLRITHGILQRRRPGHVFYLLFVSSLASMSPMPLKATYAASKRFLLDFSMALGQELRSENVRVTALCPAGLPTTPEALQGIAAQGFLGAITTSRLERLVRRTITRLLHGQRIYIPGLVNRILHAASKLVPAAAISRMIYKRWSHAQSKWLSKPA